MSTSFATPLSRQDAGYLRRETPGQPMHFVLACTLAPDPEGRVTLEGVRAQVAERIHRIPALRHRLLEPPLGIGPLRWIDDPEFDIERHVLAWPTVPADGDVRLDGLHELTRRPIDRTRPLWELRVAPATAGRSPVVSFATHHALMDGGLTRSVMDALFGAEAGNEAAAWRPRPAPSAARLLAEGIGEAVSRRIRRRRQEPPSRRVTGPSIGGRLAGPVGPDRAIRLLTLPLEDVRRASRASGVTINDIFLAMVTQGLRGLLRQRGTSAEGRDVIALVPRDVRSERESDTTGNRTWSMFVPLPVTLDDPVERLAAIEQATGAAKQAAGPAGTAAFAFDVSVSNVSMGGPHRVCGLAIGAHHAAVPLQGHNRLAILGISSPDTFAITITADGHAFPDIDVLVAGLARGLVDLPAADGINR